MGENMATKKIKKNTYHCRNQVQKFKVIIQEENLG